MNLNTIKSKLLNSNLFKDTIWAVLGNGIGDLLVMLAGISIARLLGKDLYGEYGVVKSTMFYISSFAAFGLGLTSTKYISQYVADNISYVGNIIRDCLKITLVFSSSLALALFLMSDYLAVYLEEPDLSYAIKMLGCIIIFRALKTTLVGILSGLKCFKTTGINNLISGVFLLVICIPFTYFYSLNGALVALLLSQFFNFIINYLSLKKKSSYAVFVKKSFIKELITFSFPVALQESSIWICNWICIMLLTKLSSSGELGLYTAAAQWNAIIVMFPVLMSNVVLSYIAETVNNKNKHNSIVRRLFTINLVSTIIPYVLILCFSSSIVLLYGPSFSSLKNVLRILSLSAVLECCTHVFKAEFISANKAWLFFIIRVLRDLVMSISAFFALSYFNGENGAIVFSTVIVITTFLHLIIVLSTYKISIISKYNQ